MNFTVSSSGLLLLLCVSALSVTCVQFPDENRRSVAAASPARPQPDATAGTYRQSQDDQHLDEEQGRIFHQHGINKKKKKKLKRRLLQCLLASHLASHRAAPAPVDAQGRFIFLNVYDIDINSAQSNYDDNDDDNNYNDNYSCGGGGGGGHDDEVPGFGQGISNLGSLVSNNPLGSGSLIPSDSVKPVYENPERFIRKYVIKPLYRTFRPLYRLL